MNNYYYLYFSRKEKWEIAYLRVNSFHIEQVTDIINSKRNDKDHVKVYNMGDLISQGKDQYYLKAARLLTMTKYDEGILEFANFCIFRSHIPEEMQYSIFTDNTEKFNEFFTDELIYEVAHKNFCGVTAEQTATYLNKSKAYIDSFFRTAKFKYVIDKYEMRTLHNYLYELFERGIEFYDKPPIEPHYKVINTLTENT